MYSRPKKSTINRRSYGYCCRPLCQTRIHFMPRPLLQDTGFKKIKWKQFKVKQLKSDGK